MGYFLDNLNIASDTSHKLNSCIVPKKY